jgi:putative PIN family toxin of toxin-antitoxin system
VRILLDTNVLISGILFRGTPRALLERALRAEIRLVTSPRLLDELEEILLGKFGFSATASRAARAELDSLAEVVEPFQVPRVCRDPGDDEVLATASAAKVEMIVTGDKDLLVLSSYEGIAIVTPAAFLRQLRNA